MSCWQAANTGSTQAGMQSCNCSHLKPSSKLINAIARTSSHLQPKLTTSMGIAPRQCTAKSVASAST